MAACRPRATRGKPSPRLGPQLGPVSLLRYILNMYQRLMRKGWRRGRDSPRREVTSTISIACPEAASSVCTSPAYQFQHRDPPTYSSPSGVRTRLSSSHSINLGIRLSRKCSVRRSASTFCSMRSPQHGVARAGEYQLMEMFSRLSRIRHAFRRAPSQPPFHLRAKRAPPSPRHPQSFSMPAMLGL